MGTNTPTIVVIDDSSEVRSLVKTRLRLSGLITVVADGADGTEAIGLAYRHQPSLLLLDMSMPSMDGLDALPGILTVSPETRVVIYSGFEERGLADRARELGAAGFIEKSLPIERLPDELLALLPADAVPPTPPPRRGLSLVTTVSVADDETRATSDDQSVLDEHLERFREVFDEAAIGMATMTLTGTLVRANRALGTLMLCKHDELVGVDYATLTSGQGEQLDSALVDINERFVDLIHLEHKVAGSSEPRRVLATLAPVRDSRGQALYIFLQVQDITAQREAEDELRQSEERFRLLVETVRDYAIFMLDPGGHITSWNSGAQRSKGYSANEVIGQHFRIFYPPEQQAELHPEHELEVALREGSYAEEGWRVRKDGTRFWANVLITAVFDETGRHLGFAKVTRDTTERRAADQEREEAGTALAAANAGLEVLNLRLRQAADEQSQFLAVTAHELRTPAAVLSGSADTLSRHWGELTAAERQGLLDGMTSSAGRLRRLLNDLLTASRLEANSLRLQLVPTSLPALLTAAADTARTANPGAEIVLDVAPGTEVLADPDRLAQVIDNLIGNALWHGASPVTVSVGSGGGMAAIRVADSGEGVHPAVLPRLFERFATGDDPGGTGLGLFIVRELARAHGGDAVYEAGTVDAPAGAFVLSVPLA